MSDYRKEILAAEAEFCRVAATDGVKDAFVRFADAEAVMVRDHTVYQGPHEIARYYDQLPIRILRLTWQPEFVECSRAGDLGYSYGQYHIEFLDQQHKHVTAHGIFHTVWKRQENGDWKFVYD